MAAIMDSIVTAACVGGSIWLLGYLDTYPMPHLSAGGLYDLGLKDIRFYCPPHVAMAVGMFNAKSVPGLYTTLAGVLIAVGVAIAVIEFGEPLLHDQPLVLRAIMVGCATLAMKLGGACFPPAAALAALFYDNAALKAMGRPYILCPGLTGTIVLIVLATVKVVLMNALGALSGGQKDKKKTS
mmetsp:Transcript_125552/g.313719  ORF Transcript_125552/g.313719 Transcript_125552/m.313719 type:complete len:183 (-) Transcript_125552:77-625(-)